LSGLSKRLRKLEGNVAPTQVEWGTTRIALDNMSNAEIELYWRARVITQSVAYYEDLSESQKAIIDQSYSLLRQRGFDFFFNCIVPLIFGDDKWAIFCFTTRFQWIVRDVKLWANRLNAENKLFEEAEEKGLCEGEIMEREGQIAKGTEDLFTHESFLRFYKEEIEPNEPRFELTEEQLASLSDLDEEDRNYVADEHKMRAEKCSICSKKKDCLYWKDKLKQELFTELYQKYYGETTIE
jgi:hypothetical protein